MTNDSIAKPWPTLWKVVASLLVSFHLFAVFAAPWGNPPPASGLAQATSDFLHPYTQSLAIDNGYRFFAPDPEASHFFRYTLTTNDGSTTNGQLPDRAQHWPRLLYHRHLMLSETAFQLISAAPDLPPELMISQDERQAYEQQRALARGLIKSLADQLLAANEQADSVELVLHERAIPTPPQVINGLKLTDDSLINEGVNLGIFRREAS